MAILVQRVSGDYHGDYFFPHMAGVGNSSNLYVWDKSVDMASGMLRLVFGLGTRAVDRTEGDYVRIVSLDDPLRLPMMNYEDQKKFSQHFADVLSVNDDMHTSRPVEEILERDLKAGKELFAEIDYRTQDRLRELGYMNRKPPYILNFKNVLQGTDFPGLMREMLALLSGVYHYPVDIEFTVNFQKDGRFMINLLQCRPLQTKGLGKSVDVPQLTDKNECFISARGNFMGGNVRLPIDYVVFVRAEAYLKLAEKDKYGIARLVGIINTALKGKRAMLVGPGRWGTTTPSLGVPVHFTELCNMSAICEMASAEAGFMPELSYGSHFFQDLVESDIFYIAVFVGEKEVCFHPERVLDRKNILSEILPGEEKYADVIHIARTDGMEIFSDIVTQTLLCR